MQARLKVKSKCAWREQTLSGFVTFRFERRSLKFPPNSTQRDEDDERESERGLRSSSSSTTASRIERRNICQLFLTPNLHTVRPAKLKTSYQLTRASIVAIVRAKANPLVRNFASVTKRETFKQITLLKLTAFRHKFTRLIMAFPSLSDASGIN